MCNMSSNKRLGLTMSMLPRSSCFELTKTAGSKLCQVARLSAIFWTVYIPATAEAIMQGFRV